ncbi:gamma-glutamylcyclotransferase [Paracoccus sp. (in: a-proteobacteria)]|uniref:gamma-glutamylcyclotransferase n=1 Tax=Paracoccus sp. TaxID=267 RepID=UPI00321F6B9D
MEDAPQHWVFAYGSLMWDPGFAVAETVGARLQGYARSFCLRSVVYRGTRAAPGLVLGLDARAGAHCDGLALRVAAPDWAAVLAGLRARELTTNAYAECALPLRLRDGRGVSALAYVIRHDHDQYAGGIGADDQARIIASARGERGANAEYLFNTARHLAQIGVEDRAIAELVRRVQALMPRP